MVKKRILVYTESFLPSLGGLENNTLLLCDSLVKLNYEVTLLTPQKKASPQTQFKVIESRSKLEFLKQVKRHKLILVNGGISFKIILPCLFLAKKYLVIYQMASMYRHLETNGLIHKLLNNIRLVLAKLATLNIGVSKYSYKALKLEFGVKKSGLLMNPADPIFEHKKDAKKASLPNSPFICLMAGRLIEGKGLFLLSKAINELNQEGNSVQLHFIGDGPAKEQILGMDPNLFFYHGSLSKQELSKWLHHANLTVIPSTSHVEGSPLIMAESLMAGTPVLASSQPAMAQAIQHPYLIFESGELESLKNKLRYLMNAKHYEEIFKHCHQIADGFSYSNYIKQLDIILKAHA